ncbi:hypothetical protein U1Q18_041157 [Sarracenia purpurea var. burkii]
MLKSRSDHRAWFCLCFCLNCCVENAVVALSLHESSPFVGSLPPSPVVGFVAFSVDFR